MAIPPDPIDTVLPKATAAVVAEVTRIVAQDPQKPLPRVKEGTTDVPGQLARQVVELRVKEAIFGQAPAAGGTLQAEKPAGEYTLAPGNQGPFLLAGRAGPGAKPVILGRYGPDTYPVDLIKARLAKHGKR